MKSVPATRVAIWALSFQGRLVLRNLARCSKTTRSGTSSVARHRFPYVTPNGQRNKKPTVPVTALSIHRLAQFFMNQKFADHPTFAIMDGSSGKMGRNPGLDLESISLSSSPAPLPFQKSGPNHPGPSGVLDKIPRTLVWLLPMILEISSSIWAALSSA